MDCVLFLHPFFLRLKKRIIHLFIVYLPEIPKFQCLSQIQNHYFLGNFTYKQLSKRGNLLILVSTKQELWSLLIIYTKLLRRIYVLRLPRIVVCLLRLLVFLFMPIKNSEKNLRILKSYVLFLHLQPSLLIRQTKNRESFIFHV